MPLKEFELIERLLRPLAAGMPGALGLADDAAVLDPPPGRQIVVAKDAMVEGVHFLPDDPPDLVARKLLRVNLSDLAAMGADPWAYLVALAWNAATSDAWLEAFVSGLARDQETFGVGLIGGDTVSTSGPLTLSLTAVGTIEQGTALRRSGTRPGDDLWVSGRLGEAALGLRALRDEILVPETQRTRLVARYRLPEPRVALGRRLKRTASACIDISDGLVADLGHLAKASGVAAEIDAAAVPVAQIAPGSADTLEAALTGGDDYELLFAAGPEHRSPIMALSGTLAIPLTRIGRASAGSGVRVRAADGSEMTIGRSGWVHAR